MRRIRFASAAVLALALTPACGRGGGDDDGFRVEIDGRARIGEETVGDGRHPVAAGDTVEMVEGEGVLELPGDRALLLRAGVDGSEPTLVEVATRPDVVAGDAVALAGDPVEFSVGGVDIALAEGAARVQRGISVTVGLYAGSAEVTAAGRRFEGGLDALRQLSVPATGVLPREAVPLVYDEDAPDPWDERFIGDAIDLGVRLDERSRGFSGQLGPRVDVDADLLRRVLPALDGETGLTEVEGLEELSPGESLVGAAIVVESDRGSFARRWDDVFGFRSAGARWGLVALDQAVERDALLGRINDAFGRSPLLFAAAPRPTGGGGGGGTTTSTSAPPGGTTTTTTTGPSTTTTTQPDDPIVTVPPVTVPPITILPEEDESERSGGVVEIVDAILDSVAGVVPDDLSP